MNSHNLLIVDDVPENIHLLYHLLKHEYEIFSATTGAKALSIIRTQRPHLILLDVMMPEMDGYEVCAALKRDATTADIPVIFITASTDAESETRALAAGGADFIHKPFTAEVVRARVRLHLELADHRLHLEELVSARTRELAEARDAAECASRAKSAFLSTVSHELRTPMNQIIGTGYLMAGLLTDERVNAHLTTIQNASRHLLGLITAILDFSRSESDRISIEAIDFNLKELFDQVAAGQADAAHGRGGDLACEIDPDLSPWLKGDPYRLRQVLSHLLDNAVKFSVKGGITLRACRLRPHDGDVTLRFEVEDQGIGIPPELQEELFQHFTQGDGSSTRRYGGLGLGLAHCRRLVSLMGGEMGVTSAPGQGSTFWFTLRLPVGAEPAAGVPGREGEARRQAESVIADLERLLADDDAQAHFLWNENRHLLEPLLSERRVPFEEAMAGFDFEAALALLREAAGATSRI